MENMNLKPQDGLKPVAFDHRYHGINSGGLYGNRTRDHILDREVLYQLS